jgi:hypothetical protein
MTPSEKVHYQTTKLRTDLFGEQNYTEFYQTATNLCVLCVFILLLFLHKSLTPQQVQYCEEAEIQRPNHPKLQVNLLCLFSLFTICPHPPCRNMVRRLLKKDVKVKPTGIAKKSVSAHVSSRV